MPKKPTIVNHAAESSKKCFHCGLRNFADRTRCERCKCDLSLPLTELQNNEQKPDNSGEFGQLKVSFVLISAALIAVLLVLVLFYNRQSRQVTSEATSEAGVAQLSTPLAEQSAQKPVQEDPQSEEAAKQVLAGLKRFQGATERSISYDEYNEMLTRLEADLNNTLPSFVRHNPSDEAFRQEVAAALRDYTAAGNWWKTSIRNSSVLNDAARSERVQANWSSAQTHLNNAQELLLQ